MLEATLIGLMFSALIPIAVFLIYKPSLNHFFKLLLASILLSILFDLIGTTMAKLLGHNLHALCLYCFFNTILIIMMWNKVPFYSSETKALVRKLGYFFLGVMALVPIFFNFTIEALYMLSSLNVFLGLVLAMQYYYEKITLSSEAPLMRDPYFVTATAFILFTLSTIVLIGAQVQFKDQPNMVYTWIFRQTFYFIYNVIIGYAFYVLFKIQQV